jgi:hypothetical protein
MEDTKPAVASTGVWGSVIALVGVFAPLVLSAVGVKAATDQQAVVATGLQLATGLGAALALYGRLTATKKIG